MCCLFGFVDYKGSLSAPQKNHLIKVLSKECEDRGTDATGVAYNSKGNLKIYKKPLPAHKMRHSIPPDVSVVMGHTRFTTQGSEKKNYNNHPFSGEVTGQKFALAHNGVLYNDGDLRKSLQLPKTKIETDSYIAVQLIEKENTLHLKSLGNMAEQVEGSFVFTVLDEENNLHFVCGDNPLCLYHYKRLGLYIYASTQVILDKALKKMKLIREKPEEIKTDSGDVLKIDSLGQLTKGKFDDNHLYLVPTRRSCYPSYGRGYFDDYARYSSLKFVHDAAEERAFLEEEAYFDELRNMASYFGYTPEEIEEFVADGVTLEEIEEGFYCW